VWELGGVYGVEISEGDVGAEDTTGEGLSCVLEMCAVFEGFGRTDEESSSEIVDFFAQWVCCRGVKLVESFQTISRISQSFSNSVFLHRIFINHTVFSGEVPNSTFDNANRIAAFRRMKRAFTLLSSFEHFLNPRSFHFIASPKNPAFLANTPIKLTNFPPSQLVTNWSRIEETVSLHTR
jgi:hypothetical protein